MNPHPPFPSMPFMTAWAPLLHLFQGMLRRGPGSEASTLRALSLCPLPAHPKVADLGCGSGASALLLARTLQVPILALDADGSALDVLWAAAEAQGLLPLVLPRCGDIAAPEILPGSLDLLWSEGAISHLGWAPGLSIWRELMRPGGIMAITEATWFDPDPPELARRLWAEWYPGMGSEASNLAIARDLGLEVLAHFRLPRQDWWDYFAAVEQQCCRHAQTPGLAELIDTQRSEIETYRQTGHSYGYTFYILRKA